MPVHLGLLTPYQDRIAGELGGIIADDHLWLAACGNQLIEFAGDTDAAKRGVGHQCRAFAGAVIHNRQHAEAAAFMGEGPHALAQADVITPCRFVSHCHPSTADGFTQQPFAHPVMLYEMNNSFPLRNGRHHFFPSKSISATLSSLASPPQQRVYFQTVKGASSSFSLPFSSSSARSRLTSDTYIPPNLPFHL